jgi:predicted PurR-regulated permease PerM
MDSGQVSTALTAVFLLGSFWMLWPFLGALLFGMLTAYILVYLEERLYDHLDNRIVSNTIVLALIAVIVAGLIYGISSSVSTFTRNIQQFITTISGSASYLITIFDLPGSLANVIDSILSDISSLLQSTLVAELRRVPSTLIDLTLYVFAVYYFYRDGKAVRTRIFELIEQLDERKRHVALTLVRSLNDLARGVFLNRLIIALTVTLLTGVGYFLMGIEFWWGWALVSGLFSFLPYFQPFLVYLPLGSLYMALGDFWLGVVIIVYGILILKTLPTIFIKPHLDTHRTKEPNILLFLGFIAGPMVLGSKGLILGPVILVLAKDFFNEIFSLDPVPS